jgi:hypothetical protein
MDGITPFLLGIIKFGLKCFNAYFSPTLQLLFDNQFRGLFVTAAKIFLDLCPAADF